MVVAEQCQRSRLRIAGGIDDGEPTARRYDIAGESSIVQRSGTRLGEMVLPFRVC